MKEKDIYLGSFYIQKDNSIGINLITYEEEKVLWCQSRIYKKRISTTCAYKNLEYHLFSM